MPQLDKVTFLSQFFWLCFFYLGFYCVDNRIVIISGILGYLDAFLVNPRALYLTVRSTLRAIWYLIAIVFTFYFYFADFRALCMDGNANPGGIQGSVGVKVDQIDVGFGGWLKLPALISATGTIFLGGMAACPPLTPLPIRLGAGAVASSYAFTLGAAGMLLQDYIKHKPHPATEKWLPNSPEAGGSGIDPSHPHINSPLETNWFQSMGESFVVPENSQQVIELVFPLFITGLVINLLFLTLASVIAISLLVGNQVVFTFEGCKKYLPNKMVQILAKSANILFSGGIKSRIFTVIFLLGCLVFIDIGLIAFVTQAKIALLLP